MRWNVDKRENLLFYNQNQHETFQSEKQFESYFNRHNTKLTIPSEIEQIPMHIQSFKMSVSKYEQ